MFGWTKPKNPGGGSVYFRGSIPPRLAEFGQLGRAGISVEICPPKQSHHWAAKVKHGQWGSGTVMCLRNFSPIPEVLLKYDSRLSKEDREAAHAAGNWVSILMDAPGENVLRDRKFMLRYLRLLMGDDGLICVDHQAEKFWSREALDEELCHEAELDVDSLFLVHSIYKPVPGDKNRHPYWMHTHGLASLGCVDFDILRPAPVFSENGFDIFRAMAFAILEGKAKAGENFRIINSDTPVLLLPVEDFNHRAASVDRELRDDPADPVHNKNRVILCDPAQPGIMARLVGHRPKPSAELMQAREDRMMCMFTSGASDLMARRAQQTFGVFQKLAAEFVEFEVQAAVKMGYRVDGGGEADREHMWFEVHGFGEDFVDATLMNKPFGIAAMKQGDRKKHYIKHLTDWMISTPAGRITPRGMVAARTLRANREEILGLMAKQRVVP